MKYRGLIAAVLALSLMLTFSASVFAADDETAGESVSDEARAVLTRGDFVTALFRMNDDWETEPHQDYFDDVAADGALARAVHWAVDAKVVNGYDNSKFGPDDPITREQMAAMLYRYAQGQGKGFTGAWMFPLNAPDADQISDYANEAMHWVVMNGILTGTDKGLEPKAAAAQDQLASVLVNCQKALIGAAEDEEIWYNFDAASIAVKAPADLVIDTYNKGTTWFCSNDRITVGLSRMDFLCDFTVEALKEYVDEEYSSDCEILHCESQDVVKLTWIDGSADYFFQSPNNDVYMLWIEANTVKHPEMEPADIAEEAAAFEESIRYSLNIPEGEKAVTVLRLAQPSIDYLVLVNKLNALPEDWEDKLETVHMKNSLGDEVEVERVAYKFYLSLKEALAEEGVYIDLDSARRSIAAQQDIMDRFIEKYGEDYALKTVAQPGYSEHHTGLALDLYLNIDGEDVYYNEDMVQYPEIWAKIHEKLADYGFILRYPEDKEQVTGYGYEPWHIRFIDDVGAAEEIMSRGVTLEEYLGAVSEAEVTVDYGTSERFSPEELKEAAVQIKCKFASWAGCELHTLRYAGDDAVSEEDLAWVNSLEDGAAYTQAVEFLMDFHSPAEAYGAWEADTEYTDYQWWLARTEDGGWNIVSWGY